MEDFTRFAPLAHRLGTKKGFLRNKPSLDDNLKQYFVLFGNILYMYASDDPTSFVNLYFLESSTIQPVRYPIADGSQGLILHGMAITTVGGYLINFYGSSLTEISEWIDAIESNKYISMMRRFEDFEASNMQVKYRTEQQDKKIFELQSQCVEMQLQYQQRVLENEQTVNKIKMLEEDILDLKSRLNNVNKERLMILSARSVVPKTLPQWAIQRSAAISEGRLSSNANDVIKLWVGSWNFSGVDAFAKLDKNQSDPRLNRFVGQGYDIYILGVQECISESVFLCMESMLEKEGYFRLALESDEVSPSPRRNPGMDSPKLYGKTESTSLKGQKFTGIGVFVNRKLRSEVKVVSIAQVCLLSQNKGAVGVALTIGGRTLLLVSSHLDTSSKQEIRRQQYQQLVSALGSKLGEPGYHLNEQFNHILWFGDLNSRLVDTSGNNLPADTSIKMLEDGFHKSLFESHDQLKQDRRNQVVFYSYREPNPFPNFYPTYKKYENRPIHDYSSKEWVKDCYKYKYKEPFYKGGSVKEKTPAYCDRVLYHSMVDLGEDLVPEVVSESLILHSSSSASMTPIEKSATKSTTSVKTEKSLDISQTGSVRSLSMDFGLSQESKLQQTISYNIDNYQSINDGDLFSVSDHSPILATFLLRTRKDYEPFKADMVKRLGEGKGNIQDLLNALQFEGSPSKQKPPSTPIQMNEVSVNQAIAEEGCSPVHDRENNSIDEFSTPTTTNKFDFTFSLIPSGIHNIRLHSLKLLWGGCEDIPTNVKILFPAPYEAVLGEKFVDFTTISKSIDDSIVFHQLPTNRGSLFRHSVARSSQDLAIHEDCEWKKCSNSKTGTCAVIECSLGKSLYIPPLQLTWRGEEPLDRLHIAMQVSMPANSFHNSSRREEDKNKKQDFITGHCALSLEQLCKAALVSSGGETGSVSLTRLLLKDGLPLFRIDDKVLQREQVTLCCTLELS